MRVDVAAALVTADSVDVVDGRRAVLVDVDFVPRAFDRPPVTRTVPAWVGSRPSWLTDGDTGAG